MRSMSATEIVTWPEMTTPLSRTRLIRSLRTSCSPSSGASCVGAIAVRASGSRPSRVIARRLHEVVRRPRATELEAKPRRLEACHEPAQGGTERRVRLRRDEEDGVERERGAAIRRVARHRDTSRCHRVRRERLEDVVRRLVADTLRLHLALGLELALEEVALPGRCR